MNSLTSPVDIRPDHLEIVRDILRAYLPAGFKVWVFGSRANWTTKDSSDLDLAVEGPASLDHRAMVGLEAAFEDSTLPYTVDVVDLNAVSHAFKQIVKKQRVPFPVLPILSYLEGEWREVTLGEVLTLQRGFDLPMTKRKPGSYPVIASTGPVGTHGEAMVRGPGVVIGRSGSLGGGQFIEHDFWPLNTTLWVKDFKGNAPRFCYYLLKSIDLAQFNVGSGVPTLNRNHIHPFPVALPPLTQQRAIAHVLGTLDDKIEMNRRMNETLEAMARALFKSWFVDFAPVRAKMEGRWRRGESLPGQPAHLYDLFPDRLVDSELGEAPEGWGVLGLGELVELAYGKALRAIDRKDGPIPVYGSNGQVGWHKKELVAGPGIVVGRKGNPGVVAWAHVDFFPIDTTFYVIPRDANGGMPFLFFALTNQDLPSVSADSAVPGLNRNLAYMNRQLVPDRLIVAEFNDYAGAIFSRRHRLEEESRALAAQRDALLPRLVSGEVGVG